MGITESDEKGLMSGRTAIAILLIAILWQVVISHNGVIEPWERNISGIALILLGWVLFAYMYRMSKELKGWIISNYIYQGIAVSLVIINLYTLVYYGMRGFNLLGVEVSKDYDLILQNVRYIALVAFYCVVLWAAQYPKRMHDAYINQSKDKTVLHIISPFLHPRVKKLKQMGLKELIATVITDERTLLVIVGLAFLWRIYISFNEEISPLESVVSGIALIVVGWLFFTHVSSMSKKLKDWPDLFRVYNAIALGLLAINIYVLVYYGLRWDTLVVERIGDAPLDYIYRDLRYIALVMFYGASIVLSKFLKRAHEEYSVLSSESASKAAAASS